MRDTSTLFKLCVKALLELSADDIKLLMQLAGVLHIDIGMPLTNEHNPTAQELMRKGRTPYQQQLDRQTKEIGKQAAARTRAKNKRKVKGQFDPAKVLATRTGGKHGGVTGGSPKGKVLTAVLDALKQTSGKITGGELAEFLNMDKHNVAACLSNAWKNQSVKELKREAGKTTTDNGKVIPTYLYWLEDK